ncbi:MAG: hypothetical protein JWM11_4367 [Planctomycetaceae bacterium]|nr:hypothetical protein [Planctomycetaceae bacterium]
MGTAKLLLIVIANRTGRTNLSDPIDRITSQPKSFRYESGRTNVSISVIVVIPQKVAFSCIARDTCDIFDDNLISAGSFSFPR